MSLTESCFRLWHIALWSLLDSTPLLAIEILMFASLHTFHPSSYFGTCIWKTTSPSSTFNLLVDIFVNKAGLLTNWKWIFFYHTLKLVNLAATFPTSTLHLIGNMFINEDDFFFTNWKLEVCLEYCCCL